jgi:hypothetical protein
MLITNCVWIPCLIVLKVLYQLCLIDAYDEP